MSDLAQCQAVVYRRDAYRVARGKGFRMHYDRGRCSCAVKDDGLCGNHLNKRVRWGNVRRVEVAS